MNHIDQLLDGFRRFRLQYYESEPQIVRNLVNHGQRPKTLMIACSDSRVTPSATYDAGLGEIFMVRNVANLVPPSEQDGHLHGTSAAIEFAVNNLKVENIVISGHSHCGGIDALINGAGGTYIGPWMEIAKSACADVMREHAGESHIEQTRALEKAAMVVSLNNLMTFPDVREGVACGTLRLYAWYFDLDQGLLYGYKPSVRRFERLV